MSGKMEDSSMLSNKAEIQKIVNNLTLFDDDLMSRVFDKNIEATELFLSIVLNQKLKVISAIGQDEMRNPLVGGRNITLDVHAIDVNGRHIDIEVQGDSKGSHVKRARFHSSTVDTRILKEGQDFKELKDSYVIFMYKHDKFGYGYPIYHAERFVVETMEPLNDGSHIIYVNGKYKADDSIGKLISDFNQIEAGKIHFGELAAGVKHFKETEEGREIMCESVEKYGDRRAKEAARVAAKVAAENATSNANINAVQKLMSEMKMSLDQAMDFLSLDSKQRMIITKQLQK